jgi:glycosyltransferase involved in cell wall biosynthesis
MLYHLIKKLNPDIVHTNCSKAGVLGRLAAVAAGRKLVVHTTHGHLFYGYYNSLLTRLIVLTEQLMAPLAKRIVLLTDRSIEEHVSRGIGRRDKFVVISPGIDVSSYGPNPETKKHFRKELNIGEDVKVIGWAGRLTRIKSPQTFLEAAAIVKDRQPGVHFALLGEGELEGQLRHMAGSLGLGDSMTFLGKENGIRNFLASIDLFALTSANEGLGLVLLEAMASGLPVIATDVGGVPEVLEGGRAGLLVRPEDPLSLARCMLSLLKNKEVTRDLVRKGRDRAAVYSEENTLEQYINLYRELLTNGAGGGKA